MTKYFAVPANKTATWGEIIDFAETAGYVRCGNDFIGCRQYNSPSGKIVFKLDV
jgi:hypothetical protein